MRFSPDFLEELVETGELAVLVSGTVTMGLEILAGRMLAPEFGSSVYTWGSIIGVFMGALSLGYHIGGKRSSGARKYSVVKILLQTAFYIAALTFLWEQAVSALSRIPLGGIYSALPATILLFGPPAYILGLISPYAAKLSRRSHEGEASGRVFMLGTVGSIAGSFGTTFLLIPSLSITKVLVILGSLAVGGASLIDRDFFTYFAGGTAFLMLLAGLGAGSLNTLGGEVIYQTQTPYQELQIVDRGGERIMYLNGQPNSAMDLSGKKRHVFEYTKYFHAPLLFTGEVDRVLFIGGGGFTGPKHFASMNISVDAVEIDPGVVRASRRYYNVSEGENLDIHTMDGRKYLQQTGEKYDVIIVDAYRKDKVPFHLTTREFYSLVHSRLDSDGVVLSNLISVPEGSGSAFFRSQYRTIGTVFPTVYAFRTETMGSVQNIEVVATKHDRVNVSELEERIRKRETGANLSGIQENLIRDVRTTDVPVLKDGKAPVSRLMDSVAYRDYTVERN